MLLVVKIHGIVIDLESNVLDNRNKPHSLQDNRHQFFHRAVVVNLRNSLSSCSPFSDPSLSTSPKVAFIDFNPTLTKRTFEFSEFENPLTNGSQHAVDRLATDDQSKLQSARFPYSSTSIEICIYPPRTFNDISTCYSLPDNMLRKDQAISSCLES
jgi:hypothetical protein